MTKTIFLPLVGAMLLAAGCTGYKQIGPGGFDRWPPEEAALAERIEVGDRIRVTRQSGEKISGTLEALQPGGLVVAGERITYDTIETVHVRGFLWTPTAIVVAGATYTVFLLNLDVAAFSTD